MSKKFNSKKESSITGRGSIKDGANKKSGNLGKLFSLVLLSLLIFLQIMDGIFTRMGISIFGIEVEGNPIMKSIIYHLSPTFGLVFIKGLAIVLLVTAIHQINKIYTKRLLCFLILLNCLYIFAVYTWYIILF